MLFSHDVELYTTFILHEGQLNNNVLLSKISDEDCVETALSCRMMNVFIARNNRGSQICELRLPW